MNDEHKRFMFDFIADSLYSIGEVARAVVPPPALRPEPLVIRIWDGRASNGESIDLYPDIPDEVRARWKPGDQCYCRGEGDHVFTLTDDMGTHTVMLLAAGGRLHGRESYEKLYKLDDPPWARPQEDQ